MRYACFILFLLFGLQSQARTFIVDSQVSFNQAYRDAQPGDSIIWENGAYSNIVMDIEKDDLFISASSLGRTVFTDNSYAELNGDNLIFSGFQYVGGNIGTKDIVNIRGSNILFEQINMRAYTCYKYLRIREESQYVTVRHCNFENRLNLDDQNILSVLVNRNQPGYHKIQYCSFKNFEGTGNDLGIEPIRIGVSTQADFISRTVVEYCYFTQCDGDGELISSKARQNIYRHNTFENNPKAELVLRHGSENVVYGNFFINGKGGVRVREGQNHYIYNNYFYELDDRAIFLQNEASDPLDDINIAFNLIHDCSEIILGGDGSNQPTNITFANNIFSDPDDLLFEEPTGMETWISNISFGNLGFQRPAGIVDEDPILIRNAAGYYGISDESSAINAASEGFKPLPVFEGIDSIDTFIDWDIMKEARPIDVESKDLGCSEYPHDLMIRPIATEENTGPGYNSSVVTSTVNISDNPDLSVEVYPNPTTDDFSIAIDASDLSDVKISLYNNQGQLVYRDHQIQNKTNTLHKLTGVQDLPVGIYLLKLEGVGSDSKISVYQTRIVKL